MDPQVIAELRESLAQLGDAVSKQTAALSGINKTMSTASTAINNTTTKTTQSTTVENLNTAETTKTTQSIAPMAKAQTEASKIIAESAANFGGAVASTQGALTSFTKNLMSSEEGFGKYGSVFTGLGDAAFSIGKSFGLLGGVLGGVAKLGGMALEHMAKQADAIGNATDSIAKMGAANAFTMDQVRQMGASAGLTSFELDKLIKPMQTVKGGLVGLGGTQAEGVKKFAQIAAVSKDVRNQFRHLGMGDQERNQAIADYLTTMNKRGAAFDGNLASQKGLQKAAIAYTKNLYELAELTGESVEDEQKSREQQMNTMEVALQENKWRQQTLAAEDKLKNGSPEERKAAQAELSRIDTEKKGFEQLNNDLRQAGLTQEQKETVQRAFLTGKLDESASKFTIMGMSLTDYLELAKQNRLKKGQFAQATKKAGQEAVNSMGIAVMGASKDAQDATIMGDKGVLKRSTQMADVDYMEQAAAAAKNINKPKNATDPAQKARDLEVETTRSLKLKVDAFEASMNPFLGNGGKILDTFKDLGIAAAVALGAIALFKGGQAVAGMFSGGGGAAAAGAATAAGAADDALSGMTGNSSGPKQDAKGRWRDASGRFTKAPDAGDVGESGPALKQAGNSFKDVVKGGTALGIALVAMGAGLAGAVWIVGKALPTLADGFKSFKEVDGKNLIGVGLGMAGLGVGVIALGVGAPMNALASLMGDDPLEKIVGMLLKLQNWNLDRKKIEDNGAALMAFAKAMTAIAGLSAIGAVGNAYKSVANALTGAFGGSTEPPYKQLQEFSNLNINAARTKNNATAFAYFSEAMASYKGLGSPTSAIGTALADTTAKFFKVRPPLEQFVYFSKLDVNQKRTKINADSFVLFSEAMASYKGGEGLISAVSTIAGAKLNALFGQDSAVDAFYSFSKKDFGSKAGPNAKAFLDFSKAMGILSGGSSSSGILGTLATGAAAVAGAVVGAASSVGNAIASALGFGKVVEAGPGFTTVQDSSGKIVKRTGARNWRNNNPGNLNYGDFAKKHKAIGTDGRFAVFPTYEDGRKAKESLLFEGSGYKNLDISRAIARYAPPSENNTTNYVNTVAKAAGVPASTPLSSLNSSQRQSMLNSMEKVEGFKVGKEEVLKARKGGLFSGPSTGYPMELHGTEMVIPQMTQNSLLTKLSKTSNVPDLGNLLEATQAAAQGTVSTGGADSHSDITFLNPEMIAALASKFDIAIEILQSSDYAQENYLKHVTV